MRPWHVVCLALGVGGCNFETAPLLRGPAQDASASGDGVGLYPDGGATVVDAASPADRATDATATHPDANSHALPDKDVVVQDPPLGTGDPAGAPTDAGTRDGSTGSEPMQPTDAATPASDAGTAPPNALRAQTLRLLQAAELTGDDRAVAALLAQLVTQSQSGAELAQLLVPLDSNGRCAVFNTVSCLTTCAAVASRCSLCLTDPGCMLELMNVCSVQGPNCR
jgi:hypothetical protein